MPEMKLGDNYRDLSVRTGTNAGFQFEFNCERCNDVWRSKFVPFTRGQATGWLGKAASIFGGVLGNVSDAAESFAESGFGSAHDKELANASSEGAKHFHRCAKCSQYVCDRCWNKQSGLCLNCAPDAEIAIEAAKAAAEAEAAAELAKAEGVKRAGSRDIKRERQLVCPDCGAETRGAKFCPECGKKMSVLAKCPHCRKDISGDSKFCPECGGKLDRE